MRDLLNLTRYELWRMAHMRMCWVYLAVCAVSAASSGRGWGLDGVYSALFSGTATFVGMMLAQFFANDLATGYAKNLLVGRHARAVYAGSAAVCALVASAVFVAAGALAAAFVHNVGGGALVQPPVVEEYPGAPEPDPYVALFEERPWGASAAWLGEFVLVCFVRSLPGIAVAVLTGSRPLGVFAGIMGGGGTLEMVALVLFQEIGLQDVGDYLWAHDALPTLNHDFMGGVPFSDPLPFALAAVIVAASAALVVFAMRRKDVSNHAD